MQNGTRQALGRKKANNGMDHTQHNRIVSFIWSIADDELRDVYL